MDHRGRVQAQGGGIEESEAWARDQPLPAPEGHTFLDTLRDKLSPSEQAMRVEAFAESHVFIDVAAAAGGAGAGTCKSFPRRPRKDQRRVDIVVIKGLAFVPN
jgi:hypothetical protein